MTIRSWFAKGSSHIRYVLIQKIFPGKCEVADRRSSSVLCENYVHNADIHMLYFMMSNTAVWVHYTDEMRLL